MDRLRSYALEDRAEEKVYEDLEGWELLSSKRRRS